MFKILMGVFSLQAKPASISQSPEYFLYNSVRIYFGVLLFSAIFSKIAVEELLLNFTNIDIGVFACPSYIYLFIFR